MESLLKQLAIEIAELSKLEKDEKVLDTKAAASYLHINQGTLRQMVRAGEIPCAKAGNKILYHKDALDKWLGV